METCYMNTDREKKITTIFLTEPEDDNEWDIGAKFPDVLDTIPKDHTIHIVYDGESKRVFTSSCDYSLEEKPLKITFITNGINDDREILLDLWEKVNRMLDTQLGRSYELRRGITPTGDEDIVLAVHADDDSYYVRDESNTELGLNLSIPRR